MKINLIEVEIRGPAGSGKTLLMHRIATALAELGVTVHAPQLRVERALRDLDAPQGWERDELINNTVVVLAQEAEIPPGTPRPNGAPLGEDRSAERA